MRRILYCFSILSVLTFCSTKKKGFINEKIVFKKEDVSKRQVYKISRPLKIGDVKKIKIFGEFGHGFEIVYSDSSKIYYSNDEILTSPNQLNYATYSDNYWLVNPPDTILQGKQNGGKYWKEIIKGGYFIGYQNVSEDDKNLFDCSIETLRF